jgi:hypothetical protein
MPLLRFPFPPQDREQLWWTVRALFGVTIPRVRVCPDHCAPFDAFADAYFRVNTIRDGIHLPASKQTPLDRIIIHASRGLAGKSKLASILGMTFAYLDGADITILGGSMTQSANVHEYCGKAMESPNLPVDMTRDHTATKIMLTNAARLRPLPASPKTARSPHPSILFCDEADEMDLMVYDAAMGQPMPQENYLGVDVPTLTIVLSTWQYPTGTFTEILRRAAEDNEPIYRWCYRESSNPVDGWLDQETIAKTRGRVSKAMWDAEYELGEPAIGDRAFDSDAVKRAFCLKFKPDDEVGEGAGYLEANERKDFEEFTFERYIKDATYVAGCDWAKRKDKTVIWVARIDGHKRRLVYFQRVNRRPYPVMIGSFNKTLRHYRIHNGGAYHDSTGLGDVVDDYVDIRARGFAMTVDKRSRMLNNYVNAIEKDIWEIPKIPSAYTEMLYCRVGDLYVRDAPRPTNKEEEFHLPDTVCAGALAEWAANKMPPLVAPQTVEGKGEPHGERFAYRQDDESPRSLADLQPPQQGISLVVGGT